MEVVRERLLAIDVLLRARRLHGDQAMPVVGHGDADGVDVAAHQYLFKGMVGGASRVAVGLIDEGFARGQMVLVDVAHRDDLRALDLRKVLDMAVEAHPSQPDVGNGHAVAGRHRAFEPER